MLPKSGTILVDDRERAGGLAAALRRLALGQVETARLDVGDVWIGARLVLERKEAADFVASLLDGRLERQVHALTGLSGRRALIIIEGEFNEQTLAGMAAADVRAALLALELDWRLPVIRSRDVEDTARWIAVLVRREAAGGTGPLAPTLRPSGASRPHPAAHRANRMREGEKQGLKTAPQAALERIDGLGPARARALLERFGTMRKILAASATELAQVPGIGPALAREIREKLAGR